MNDAAKLAPPSISTNVVGEVRPKDPSTWSPNSFAEWETSERIRAYLGAWTQQMEEERNLRSLYAKLIFGLIAFEVVAGFSLLILVGVGFLKLDVDLVKIVFSGIMAQVVGLGFLVTKYLFNKPLQHSIDGLVKK